MVSIFWFIPGALFVIAYLYNWVQEKIEEHRQDYPYIGHLNYRRDYLHNRH